ncbi:MAG TPA: HupE/UreJ family protein [Hyphomonadaceae bacterium]|nr:HupE/UreJ family protein [Hyphomonadaceae bacterium]
MIRLILTALAALAFAPAAVAHEIRPAFLQVREVEPNTYDFLWKTPARGDLRLALNVIQPDGCANVSEPRATLLHDAVIERWRTQCEGGLVGKQLAIENLPQTLTDAIVRIEHLDRSPQTLRLTPDRPSATVPDRQPWTDVAASYFVLGVEHILLGFDHLLFVLALLILVSKPRRLIGAVTAFTVAHSLTLAGTTFGWVKLPIAPVEATIALSIMFVAVEIMRVRAGQESLTARLPWLASFAFGLLHGFGFAGALREIGMPEDAAPLALLFFNLGVEAGQLLFIAAVLLSLWVWRRLAPSPPAWVLRAPVYVIGAGAAFWFIERTAGMIGL